MQALVGIIMGSSSDWETMQSAVEMLERLGIAHEVRVISAHRTPDLLFEYAAAAKGQLKVRLNSQIREIRSEDVVLKHSGQELKLRNDAVIVSAGGVLPNDFLKSIGVEVETKFGTA